MKIALALVIAIASSSVAIATPVRRTVDRDGSAPMFGFVGSPDARGRVRARQVVPATSRKANVATSRVLYLNRNSETLTPGDNDSANQVSSIVPELVQVPGLDIDDGTWSDIVQCVTAMYARFDVTVTDQDPGTTPHIEALLGGSPADIGLPDNVAGVSPFSEDCGIIESSIVFIFTDVIDDAQTACEVASQELAHSFGLDHEMLASDPMTYLDYDGPRAFQEDDASCGEYEARPCGINGTTCRSSQSSVGLLKARIGASDGSTGDGGNDGSDDGSTSPDHPRSGGAGCSAGGSTTGLAVALAMLAAYRRRLRRAFV